eukprot:15114666-Alexandrium_andersonii.AAC.1
MGLKIEFLEHWLENGSIRDARGLIMEVVGAHWGHIERPIEAQLRRTRSSVETHSRQRGCRWTECTG